MDMASGPSLRVMCSAGSMDFRRLVANLFPETEKGLAKGGGGSALEPPFLFFWGDRLTPENFLQYCFI